MSRQQVFSPSGVRLGRLPKSSGDLHHDAVAEFRWSMAGRGLTVDKLVVMRAVSALPVVCAATSGVPEALFPSRAYEVVTRAVRELGEGLHARLLRASLGIDYAGDGKDLTERRLEFIQAHNDQVRAAGGRNFLGETTRASYAVEQQMLEALVTVLGVPGVTSETRASDAPVTPSTLWNDTWRSERIETTCRFHGRAIRVTEVADVLVAGEDGVSEYRRAFSCDTDSGPPAQFVLLEGGEVVDERPLGRPNFRVVTIRLPRALAAGERHRLRFDVRYPRKRMSEPWMGVRVMRPIRHLTLWLAFDVDELPSHVWRIDGLPPGCGGGSPDDGTPLVPDRLGLVQAQFEEPTVGLQVGAGWEW